LTNNNNKLAAQGDGNEGGSGGEMNSLKEKGLSSALDVKQR